MVSIREIKENESIQLARLISEDHQIRSYLGFPEGSDVSSPEVLKDIEEWQFSRSAACYGIYHDKEFAGMISLSHIDYGSGTGRVGYWLGTRFRGRGICSEAFELVIGKAASLGLNSISSTVNETNMASRSIWERNQAQGSEIASGKIRYTLDIKHRPVVSSGGKGRI